ncbi:MAG: glycosyltransferase [Nocardioidaceae bacterium]
MTQVHATTQLREVDIAPAPLERLAALVNGDRAQRIFDYAVRARALLSGRTLWNVNATASGGGVAEMLQALLAYSRGSGIETRWLVLDGNEDFFRLTKRLHNHLHGTPGDGGLLGEGERWLYEHVLAENLRRIGDAVRPGDVVLLHDPQTAGLAAGLREAGARVVWRCHVGLDSANVHTDLGWEFLRPYVEHAEAVVFSRKTYAPAWVDPARLREIPPSLDPFSTKNHELTPDDVRATLRRAGLVRLPRDGGRLAFVRRDGSAGTVRRHTGLVPEGGPLPPRARMVLQVSRWDRLKDMTGVMAGFAAAIPKLPGDVHLMLVGPEVDGVGDDPEGAGVLAECRALWHAQPAAVRARIHLCSLPMDDVDENAHLVNALQRYANVVVQKSVQEGFGLTVTEPMWKGRPVVASRVGGIQDQIVSGESGLLLDDPHDLEAFGGLLVTVLEDRALAARLGEGARARVQDRFLADRHLIQWVDLFAALPT